MTEEDISCKTIAPQYGVVIRRNEEDLTSWFSEPNKQSEIRREIDNITKFLKFSYGLIDKNIEISMHTGKPTDVPRPNYINGVRYEIDDIRYKIVGEIFIVFVSLDIAPYIGKYPYYMFRTEIDKIPIDKIPYDPVEIYTRFRIEIVELSDVLGLKMNNDESIIEENKWTEPIFYQRQENVDMISFGQFIEDITHIGNAFPLRLPKRKWYSCYSSKF